MFAALSNPCFIFSKKLGGHMSGMIGNAKIITFRATRDDSMYGLAISAIARGISTGHVALLLTFTDQELFEKYIANNTKIPHAIKIDPKTQREYYEVYVSFWPQKQAGFYSDASELRSYEYDVENSVMYTPFEYSPKLFAHAQQAPSEATELSTEQLAEMIAPLTLEANELRRVRDLLQKSQQKAPFAIKALQKDIESKVPFMGKSVITLGPIMIVHNSSLIRAFGDHIATAVEAYAQAYTEWREVEVKANNYKVELGAEHFFTKQYSMLCDAFKIRVRMAETNLQHKMFPGQYMSHEVFMQKLAPFVTLGATERDSISIPIVREANSETTGLALEPMLQYVSEIANNPDIHKYHVLKLNCAAVTYNTLWAGAKNSSDQKLRQYLALAWYVNLLSLTLTPSMIIKNAAKAETALMNSLEKAEKEVLRFSSAVKNSQEVQACSKLFTDMFSFMRS